MPQNFHSQHLHSGLHNEMRSVQNSFVCLQTEMSAHGLSGWQCCSHMYANMPTQRRLQHTDAERDTKTTTHTHYLTFPISSLYRHSYSVKSHCCCIYRLGESLFWGLTGWGEPVNSQACRVMSNNKDSGLFEQQQTLHWSPPPPPTAAPTHPCLI